LGNYYYRGLGDYDSALHELAIAEKSIPENPELHLILASINRVLGNWSVALEEIERAVELDSRNPFYRHQLFITHMYQRDYASADATLDRTLMLYPDEAAAHADKVFLALVGSGNTELAHRYDKAVPTRGFRDSRRYAHTRWLAAIFDRDYDTARSVLDELPGDVLFDVDEIPWARSSKTLFYARTYALAGDNERARASYQSAADEAQARLADAVLEDPSALAAIYLALAEAEAGLGHHESAREWARHANGLLPSLPPTPERAEWRITYAIRVLLPLGDDEAALDELERYLAKQGAWSIDGLRRDPRLARIHDHPRFAALVEAHGRD
jgi:tetratricopeptide (TPR) repeat protein